MVTIKPKDIRMTVSMKPQGHVRKHLLKVGTHGYRGISYKNFSFHKGSSNIGTFNISLS